jgi:hypothetical protein
METWIPGFITEPEAEPDTGDEDSPAEAGTPA